MSPMGRRVLRIAALCAGLIVLFLLALPYVVSMRSMRARIVGAAQSALHRKVDAGAIRLQIFSGLGLRLEQVVVRNPSGWESPSLLSAERVSVKIAFWPLISRRVEVRRVVLDGVAVAIERDPKGALNIDDFLSASGRSSGGASRAAAAAFLVSHIEIARGSLRFLDRKIVPGRTTTVAVDDLTGHIADIGPSTAARFDLAARFLSGGGRNLTLNGSFGPPAQGRPLGESPVKAILGAKNLALSNLGPYIGASPQGDPGVLSLDARAEGAFLGTLQLSGRVQNSIPAGSSSPIPAFDGQFVSILDWPHGTFVLERAPVSVAKLPLTLEGRVDDLRTTPRFDLRAATPGDVAIDSVTGLPGIAGSLPGGVKLSGRVRLSAEVQGPSTDLAAHASLEAAPLGVGMDGAPLLATASASATLESRGEGPLSGRVSIPAGTLKALPFEGLTADWSWEKGVLTLTPSARVYGGTLRARVESDLAHREAESRVTLEVAGVQGQPLVESLTTVRNVFSGTLTGKMSLVSRGLAWEAISKTGRGDGKVSVADADLRTVQLLPEVARALSAIGRVAGFRVPAGLESTRFDRLETSLRLGDGRLATPDLTLSGGDVSVHADGSLGLDKTLSYQGRVDLGPSIVKSLGSAGRSIADPQGRVALPFRVTGPIPAPRVAIDESVVLDLGRRVLGRQAREKVGGAAGKVLGDVLDGGGGQKANPVDLLQQLLKEPAPTPTPR